MPHDLSDLNRMRDKLIEARAKGVTRVQIGMERVDFKSDSEMASALADLDMRIRRMSKPPVHTIKFTTSKGL